MPYITCELCRCGGVQSLDINICTRCIKFGNDKTKILAIKKYLEKHPEAKAKEISRALGIEREVIDRFIKEGTLMLVKNGDGAIAVNELQEKEIEDAKEKRRKLVRQLSDMEKYSRQRFNEEQRSQLLIDLDKKKNFGQQR